MRNLFLACSIALFSIVSAKAQQGQSVSGGMNSGTGGTVSYTVGQLDYTVDNGIGGTVNQGLQQPFEILVISGISQNDIFLNCTVSPNPSMDYVQLKVPQDQKGLTLLMYNTAGDILALRKLTEADTRISLKGFADGIYYIRVMKNNKEEKTFKIIKHS